MPTIILTYSQKNKWFVTFALCHNTTYKLKYKSVEYKYAYKDTHIIPKFYVDIIKNVKRR